MKRFLAFVHRLCPLCVLRRIFPQGAVARLVRRLERCCPFCRAAGENSKEPGA